MKTKLLILQVLILQACAPVRIKPLSVAVSEFRGACATTKQGVLVEAAAGAACPSAGSLDTAVQSFFNFAPGATPHDLAAVEVVFVPYEIRCGTKLTVGCTAYTSDGVISFVTENAGWVRTLRHELGHQWLWRRVADFDAGHTDCVFWAMLDNSGVRCEDKIGSGDAD
jgi:hypothetical protein